MRKILAVPVIVLGVGPNGEIPLNAQLRGSDTNGILNICGPEGCV